MSERLRTWLLKHLGGHVSFDVFGRHVVIYGFNAMHVAINIHTRRWGYICLHPPIHFLGWHWPWYFYVSPNATPWASTYAVGPGVEPTDKRLAPWRLMAYGHNFDSWEIGYHGCQFQTEPTREED